MNKKTADEFCKRLENATPGELQKIGQEMSSQLHLRMEVMREGFAPLSPPCPVPGLNSFRLKDSPEYIKQRAKDLGTTPKELKKAFKETEELIKKGAI